MVKSLDEQLPLLGANTIRRLWPNRHDPYTRLLLRQVVKDSRVWLRLFGDRVD